MVKPIRHSLIFRIPHDLYARVKVAAFVKNISIARFIREALNEEVSAIDHHIDMNFFKGLERKKKAVGKNGLPYQTTRILMTTPAKASIKIYASEKNITMIQLANYALNEKLNREGFC